MVTDQAILRQQVENNANLPAPIIDSAVTENDVPGTSGTTGTIVTLENVFPYPKAVLRARKSNRKKVKSAIITDLTSNSTGTAKKKTAVKQLKTVESSSKSETEPFLVESNLEVYLTDMSKDELEISASDAAIKQKNYVLVTYERKRKVHFVGQILKEKDEDGDLEIKFLRKHPKISNGFVEPAIEDIRSVSVASVTLVLPQPCNPTGSTRRAIGIKKFHTDFSAYDM